MGNLQNICFVTGTRAEFGLMRSVLEAIAAHPRLRLQLAVTGMHLDRARGRTIDEIRSQGWKVDATIPWKTGEDSPTTAQATGQAIAGMSRAFEKLQSDVVLVVGDRVEAFAAATAGHVGGRIVAHVHGGDRALGQIDDSLRHAITKLAHVHFPATTQSAQRIRKLGEDSWRIFRTGSPGLDDIHRQAATRQQIAAEFPLLAPRQYVLLLLHPESTDPGVERRSAAMIYDAVREKGYRNIVIVYPNTDPGAQGIIQYWRAIKGGDRTIIRPHIPRATFLGLLRESAGLIGNSSSGIIEAASFGVPVLDIGDRQKGRQRSKNVRHAPLDADRISRRLPSPLLNWRLLSQRRGGRGVHNVYGGGGAGRRIARVLAELDALRFRSKLISY